MPSITAAPEIEVLEIEENNPTERRGGFRKNSSFIHRQKKTRNFTCAWCRVEFASTHVGARFCSIPHRRKAYTFDRCFRTKKRLTDKARKGRCFRSPSRDASALLLKARKGK